MLNALRTNFRQISNVLSEGVDANGGYLVPEEYDSRLIDTLTEENIMRKLGHTITTSGEHKINMPQQSPLPHGLTRAVRSLSGTLLLRRLTLTRTSCTLRLR